MKSHFTVPRNSEATLAALVKEDQVVPHSKAKAIVAFGLCTVNGQVVRDPVFRPAGGSTIEIAAIPKSLPRTPRRLISGPGFRVLHLDRQIVVADKDPMIVTIPTGADDPSDASLVARVGAALAVAGHKVHDLWVVHRIDRETSGLVLFARTQHASEYLRNQFRARTPLREYLCWSEGIPTPPKGRLRHRLHEDDDQRRVVAVGSRSPGKEAECQYQVEAQREGKHPRARVRVRLVTGRRNQIRVQFSACGWPLLGDRFYGAKDRGCGRTALHAVKLGFDHPLTGQPVSFESSLPRDLRALDRELFNPSSKRGSAPKSRIRRTR
jgi:23S rRNA pseudouridine1911/1915/1917 synthase